MSRSITRAPYEHPSMEGWLEAGRNLPDESQKAALYKTFEATGHSVDNLIGALSLAMTMTDTYRQKFEAEAVEALGLNSNDSQKQEYLRLAGDPNKLVDYLCWFSKTAGFFFTHDNGKKYDYRPSKIGLELGSVRQAGSWENTGQLDRAMETIPDTIRRRREQGVSLKVLSRPGERAEAYRYTTLPGTGPDGSDQYGLIRRRRAVANMTFAITGLQMPSIQIYKESTGLVVLDQFPPDDQKRIIRNIKANPADNVWTHGKNNTPAAHLAGHAFHEAVHDRHSTKIVPTGAQYIAVAIRDSLPSVVQ